MSVMGISLGFGFTKANIRFQRCFGIGCLEFEGWLLFDIYRTAYAVYRDSIYLQTCSTDEFPHGRNGIQIASLLF